MLYDDNHITIDGPTSLSFSDDVQKRFEGYHWHVQRIDGHDTDAIAAAIDAALADDRPSLIACKTIIGWGAPNKQGTSATHGSPLGKDEVAATRANLNWPYPPFEVPEATVAAWREIGKRGEAERLAWDAAPAEDPGRGPRRLPPCHGRRPALRPRRHPGQVQGRDLGRPSRAWPPASPPARCWSCWCRRSRS